MKTTNTEITSGCSCTFCQNLNWSRSLDFSQKEIEISTQYNCNSFQPHIHVLVDQDTPEYIKDEFQEAREDELFGKFEQVDRWDKTNTSGNSLSTGDPTIITWSIIPDGTSISGFAGEDTSDSDLVSFLREIYGITDDSNDTDYTDETWFDLIEQSLNRWSAISGVTYIYEPNDDGNTFVFSSGSTGVRGDVRIGGHAIDGKSGILAYNFYPDYGDMVIDTNDSSYGNIANDSLRLRNIIAHEAGHGLGLAHVVSGTGKFLMEPKLNTSFEGPQFDDILGVQRGYGDFYEGSNNNQGNDEYENATNLGLLNEGQTLSIGTDASDVLQEISLSQKDFISIDALSDVDFFSFSIASPLTVDIILTPKGPTYNQGSQGGSQSPFNTKALNDLSLELYDPDGTNLLNSVDVNGIGLEETISDFQLDNSGTYYVRIAGNDDFVQMYQLDILGMASVIENNIPNAVDDNVTTNQDTVVNGNVLDGSSGGLDTDADGDNLSVISNSPAANGTVTVNVDGSFSYTPQANFNGSDSFNYTVSDGNGGEDTATVNITVNSVQNTNSQLNLEIGVIDDVGSDWQTVILDNNYHSMIVIATINYGNNSEPAVTRVRNAQGNSFEIKVQNPSDNPLSNYSVHYTVIEEGIYTQAEHGINMEAIKFTSTITDSAKSFAGQQQTYENNYDNPVVIGQVMSANDNDWSAFWSRGSSHKSPADRANLYVGKHIAEDNDLNREDELIGYLVIESGQGEIDGLAYVAGLGTNTVKGYDDNPAYNYDLGNLDFTPSTAVVNSAGMNGKNGGWSILYGDNPLAGNQLSLTIDEDQIGDLERNHTDEQVSYLVFGSNQISSALIQDNFRESFEQDFLNFRNITQTHLAYISENNRQVSA